MTGSSSTIVHRAIHGDADEYEVVKSMRFFKMILMLVASSAVTQMAFSDVRFSRNGAGQTTELSGLFRHDPDCSTTVDVSGRIVKREFESDAVTLKGFVVEGADGTRKFVNVDIPNDLNMMTRDAVFDGLQRMLRQGRVAHGGAIACGAGGRFLNLEHLK